MSWPAARCHSTTASLSVRYHVAIASSGSAVATVPTHLGSPGVGWLYSPGMLGNVRIRVTPARPGAALFVGIGPSADVDRYLRGTAHTIVTETVPPFAMAGCSARLLDAVEAALGPAPTH